MTNARMPIESATITVTGEGAPGVPSAVYDQDGLVPGMDGALVIPPKGSFTMEVQTDVVYPYDTQTLGGGCPEWITLEDATESGKTPRLRVKASV